MKTIVRCLVVFCLMLSITAPVSGDVVAKPTAPTAGTTERVSVASDESQANGESGMDIGALWAPSISADGRYVAFHSTASNLVDGDTNGWGDVFVRDRIAGTTERVSVGNVGTQAEYGESLWQSISADGRYVAFSSWATNLVDGDTNSAADIFVRDRVAETTERVSVASDESQANGVSLFTSISADGRYVAFYSDARNLVNGDTNNWGDVFVRDRVAGTTERVSVASDGSQGNSESSHPSISADGRYVAFQSGASNLVDGDTNGPGSDVFVHDRLSGTTELISVADGYGYLDPAISANGRYVAYMRSMNYIIDTPNIFFYDRITGTTESVSVGNCGIQPNGVSFFPAISADGKYVVFYSWASNLVTGDTNGAWDFFVRDRVTGIIERVSIASDGTQADLGSEGNAASISADGRYVAFESDATNLVDGDTNGYVDVFVRDRGTELIEFTGSCVYIPVVAR